MDSFSAEKKDDHIVFITLRASKSKGRWWYNNTPRSLLRRHFFTCQKAKKRDAKPQISNTLIFWGREQPHIMNETRGRKSLRQIKKSLILLDFLLHDYIATDQKVGGSNPSGRATEKESCRAALFFRHSTYYLNPREIAIGNFRRFRSCTPLCIQAAANPGVLNPSGRAKQRSTAKRCFSVWHFL